MSDDGRYVAFDSFAALVPSDTNGVEDVYLRDRDADSDGSFDEPGAVRTVRISTNRVGAQSDDESNDPWISGNGRYVSFGSDATNLVPNDTNGVTDVFIKCQCPQPPS